MNLTDKVIVVTGGSSGIGLEVAKALAPSNQVVVLGRRQHLVREMTSVNPRIHAVRCDLSQPVQVDQVSDLLIRTYPKIDVLINNAAVQNVTQFLDEAFDVNSISSEIEINFASVCRISYRLLPCLLGEERSIILNVNSGLAIAPKTTSAVYCATKAALNSFSTSLNYQLEKTNIRVLQAFMPLVDTPMTQGRGAGKISAAKAARSLLDGLAAERQRIDVGKVRVLRLIDRFSPALAHKIMKSG